MYGGYGTTQTNGGTVGYLSDLWAWNTSSLVWTQIVSAAIPNIPGFIAERAGVPSGNNRSPARCCAASFMDSTGRLYFYGGYGLSSIANQPSSDTDFVADVWALETAPSFHDRIWTWIGGGVSRTPPAPVWPPYATNPSTISVFESPSADPSFPSSSKDPGNLPEYDAFVPPGDPPPPHPGARAWVTTWQLNSEEEAWIFGSIGTSPFSSMTQPAYFQDFWAFVFPPVTDTPTAVIAPTATKNLPIETIVWATVAGELFFVALAIILVWHRRDAIRQSIRGDKHGKPALTNGERSNSTEMKSMANGGTNNSHTSMLDNKGGAVFAAPAGYPNPGISGTTTTTSGINPASYSSGSVPSMNSSSVTFPSGSGPFTRSSRSKSGATTGTTTTTTSGASIVTSPVTGAVMGRSIHASFDLVIRKKDLEFGNIIGRGSSGTIYAGRWHEHRVAIKQLATEVLIGEREGALQEARLVSQLRPHPNVIQIFGVCVTKQHVFIIMAKMHSSLDKLIYHVQRRKWLTVERTYRMAMGIVAGMLHLESQGICHRDLAARNVCLSKVGTPCIADFGMSRKLNFAASAAETVTQMGPVAWMAPECFLQKYSSKSDVWSFGIVLYEMLSGSVPHRGTDLHTLAVAIRDTGRTPSPIPSDADPGLVAIMQSCWAYDPNERPTFAQIFKQLRDLSQSGVDESEDIDFYQEEKLPTSEPSSSSSRKYERSKIRVASGEDASTTPSTASPKPTTSGTSIPKSGNSSGENATTSSFPYSTESGASSTTSSSSNTSDPNHNSDSSAPPFNPSAAVSKLPTYPSPFSQSPLPSPPVNRVASPPPTGHGDYVTGF
jgi:tRNA A-37 threonylcarbamoyl transferase component Bud32